MRSGGAGGGQVEEEIVTMGAVGYLDLEEESLDTYLDT